RGRGARPQHGRDRARLDRAGRARRRLRGQRARRRRGPRLRGAVGLQHDYRSADRPPDHLTRGGSPMANPIQETLVLVKPDGVARNLTGEILARIAAKGYSLVDLRMLEPERALLEEHYAEHAGKPFFEPLLEFMQSGPIVAARVAGQRVIEGFR